MAESAADFGASRKLFSQNKNTEPREKTEMEEEGIGLVLARASELRSKISSCIHKAKVTTAHKTSIVESSDEEREDGEEEDRADPSSSLGARSRSLTALVDADDEETVTLLNIRDALHSLEAQLATLQDLQQQQQYEREAALAEIDYSRKILLNKLMEYKGKDLEVIREASAFASETVEHDNDLLLPPYPSRPPQSLMRDNGFLSHFPSARKLARNGVITGDPTSEAKNFSDSERNQRQIVSRNSWKGLRHLINLATRTVLTLVGVVSILNLAGFEPRLSKRDAQFKVFGSFQRPAPEKRSTEKCPPGKVLVVENGEARCLVKERVEIPFESVVAKPDVNYGCG